MRWLCQTTPALVHAATLCQQPSTLPLLPRNLASFHLPPGAEGSVFRGRWHHIDVAVKEMHPQSSSFTRLASIAQVGGGGRKALA